MLGPASLDAARERARFELDLARMCGLPASMSANACGQSWCSWFDEEHGTCALLEFGIVARVSREALEWLVEHRRGARQPSISQFDRALGARCASF